jgi:hypothetical protein
MSSVTATARVAHKCGVDEGGAIGPERGRTPRDVRVKILAYPDAATCRGAVCVPERIVDGTKGAPSL